MNCPIFGELNCTGNLCGMWSSKDCMCSIVSAVKHEKAYVEHLKKSSEYLKVIATKEYMVDCH